MAITGSYSTSTGVNFNLIAYYSYEQNTSANTSTVTITLKAAHNTINASALSGSYLSVAGNKVEYSKHLSKSTSGMTETTLATKTVTISHSSAGKGTCSIKATFVFNGTYGGKYIGTLTLSETLTLKDIPRASALSVPSSMNTGSPLKITITPSDASFKHKISFIIDGVTKYTSDFIPAGTNTRDYDIAHSWSPDNSSKTMTARLYTYTSGGTFVASIDKTVTINVPADIIPVVKSITPTIVNGLSNKYVQGKSKVTLSVSAEPGNGSTITDYYYSGKNIYGNDEAYSGTSSSVMSGVLQSPGSITYQVRVKDARGRYSEWSPVTIYVEAYSVPKILSIQAQRCLSDGTTDNNGTYAKVTVKTSHASVDGQNTATVKLTSSKDGHKVPTTIISSSAASNTYSDVYSGGFEIDASYTITAIITDEYDATHTLSVPLKAAQRSLNIAKYGNGVAIGGLSTVTERTDSGKFECNWDADINAKLSVSGDVTIKGFNVPEIQHGSVSITPSAANTPTSKLITFNKQFSGAPNVLANAHTAVPGTTVLGVGTASNSSTDCTIWLTRTNTTATTVNWLAVY